MKCEWMVLRGLDWIGYTPLTLLFYAKDANTSFAGILNNKTQGARTLYYLRYIFLFFMHAIDHIVSYTTI